MNNIIALYEPHRSFINLIHVLGPDKYLGLHITRLNDNLAIPKWKNGLGIGIAILDNTTLFLNDKSNVLAVDGFDIRPQIFVEQGNIYLGGDLTRHSQTHILGGVCCGKQQMITDLTDANEFTIRNQWFCGHNNGCLIKSIQQYGLFKVQCFQVDLHLVVYDFFYASMPS